MERVTIRIPSEMVEDLDNLVDRGEYPSRSEAIRAGVRELDGVCEDTIRWKRGPYRRTQARADGGAGGGQP